VQLSIFKQKSGFSMVEVLVSLGIMVIVTGLFAMSLVGLKKSQSEFEDKNDALLFMNGLTSYLMGNQQSCSNAINNQYLPAPGAPAVPFQINGYNGYGFGGGTLTAGSVISGSSANARTRIQSMSIGAKTGVPDVVVRSNGNNYTRRVATISIVLEKSNHDNQMTFTPLPTKYIEFPVYINGAGIMSQCQLEMQPADVCQMIGATLTSNGACKPAAQCQIKGAYVVSSCFQPYSGCMPGVENPVTGAMSCPSDSTASKTGEYSQSFQVSCGKKCSYDVINIVQFFVCMKCN